jgi:hypothetical protein
VDCLIERFRDFLQEVTAAFVWAGRLPFIEDTLIRRCQFIDTTWQERQGFAHLAALFGDIAFFALFNDIK